MAHHARKGESRTSWREPERNARNRHGLTTVVGRWDNFTIGRSNYGTARHERRFVPTKLVTKEVRMTRQPTSDNLVSKEMQTVLQKFHPLV